MTESKAEKDCNLVTGEYEEKCVVSERQRRGDERKAPDNYTLRETQAVVESVESRDDKRRTKLAYLFLLSSFWIGSALIGPNRTEKDV